MLMYIYMKMADCCVVRVMELSVPSVSYNCVLSPFRGEPADDSKEGRSPCVATSDEQSGTRHSQRCCGSPEEPLHT